MKQVGKFLFVAFCLLFTTLQSLAQETLTPELLWKLKRLSGAQLSPDGKFVLYQVQTFDIDQNKGNTDLYLYDVNKKSSQVLTNTPFSEMDARWGKENDIYFLSAESGSVQLYRMHVLGKKEQITFTEREIEGYTFSPNEQKLLLIHSVKAFETVADKYPQYAKATVRMADDLMYRHWNYWNDELVNHIFVYDRQADGTFRKGKDINAGEKTDALTPPFSGTEQITFSMDGSKIIYASKKKIGKEFATSTNSELYEYDLTSGQTRLLPIGQAGYDTKPTAFKTKNQLLWLSMKRDGFEADKNDLFWHDFSTGKTINLTKELDYTVEHFVLAPDEKSVYLTIPTKGTTQIFNLDLTTKKWKQITTGRFDILDYSIGKDQLFYTRQSMIDPTDLFVFDLKKGTSTNLTEINKDILSKIKLPTVEERWIETTDGKKMLTWVLLPPKHENGQKHPTLLYCQGGPQSMVSQFFSYRWNLALMASQGYVVVAPNRRGLPGFGQEWNDAISQDWGGQAMRDYLRAIDEVSKESFVDADKMGAVGASYGGYSVYYLAGIHEGRFKTFIAHCGLFNLESWYGTTEELFFANWDNKGPYWLPENKEYYEKNSPHRFVQNWDTPILVIHGGMDFRVPEGEGMQAFQVAQLKGLKSKYLLFPTEGHWVTSPQNGLIWQKEFFEWLEGDLGK